MKNYFFALVAMVALLAIGCVEKEPKEKAPIPPPPVLVEVDLSTVEEGSRWEPPAEFVVNEEAFAVFTRIAGSQPEETVDGMLVGLIQSPHLMLPTTLNVPTLRGGIEFITAGGKGAAVTFVRDNVACLVAVRGSNATETAVKLAEGVLQGKAPKGLTIVAEGDGGEPSPYTAKPWLSLDALEAFTIADTVYEDTPVLRYDWFGDATAGTDVVVQGAVSGFESEGFLVQRGVAEGLTVLRGMDEGLHVVILVYEDEDGNTVHLVTAAAPDQDAAYEAALSVVNRRGRIKAFELDEEVEEVVSTTL